MGVLKPSRLRKGDLIGLVSPAGTPSSPEKIEKAVRYFEALGYRVVVGKHAASVHGYLAGTDDERAGDINQMIRSSEVKAIFASRGGYGSPRLLPLIDYNALRRSPKIFVGFSDITALQLAIYKRCKLVTFSGPVPAVEFWQTPDPYTEENFWRLLTSNTKVGVLANPPDALLTTLRSGIGSGILLGGNLAMLGSTFGTPYLPSFRDSILVLEEVGEYPYRVDRLLTQLLNSRVPEKISGVVFGHFTNCEPKDKTASCFTTTQLLEEFAQNVSCPVLGGLQYGHIARKLTIPFGLRAKLNAGKQCLDVTESAVL